MRSHSFTFRVAGPAACALALAVAPAAYAEGDAGTITVAPSAVPPGGEVELRVHGCSGATGRAVSDVFVSEVSLAPSADVPELFAEATVKSSAAPGTYRVVADCGVGEAAARGTVEVAGSPLTPSADRTPTAPVQAGGGGAAQMAMGPTSLQGNGPGTRHAVIGLVLAGIAAVAVAARSVRRRRGQD